MMNKSMFFFSVVLGVSSLAFGQNNDAAIIAKAVDITFFYKALQAGNAQIRLGQLAQKNGADPDLKQFAQQMVTERTKLNNQLIEVRKKTGVADFNSPRVDGVELVQRTRLPQLSGKAFDVAYVNSVIKYYEVFDLDLYRKTAAQSQTPEIKQLASDTIPILEHDLDTIKTIRYQKDLF